MLEKRQVLTVRTESSCRESYLTQPDWEPSGARPITSQSCKTMLVHWATSHTASRLLYPRPENRKVISWCEFILIILDDSLISRLYSERNGPLRTPSDLPGASPVIIYKMLHYITWKIWFHTARLQSLEWVWMCRQAWGLVETSFPHTPQSTFINPAHLKSYLHPKAFPDQSSLIFSIHYCILFWAY